MNSASSQDFELWVKSYSSALYAYGRTRLGQPELVEDLVQDTFLTAYKNLAQFRGESSPKTWLVAILKRKIAEHFRTELKKTETYALGAGGIEACPLTGPVFANGAWRTPPSNSNWAENQETKRLFNNPEFLQIWQHCMQDLPPNWNLVIQSRYVLEKTAQEICQENQLSPSNYWQIIHRAKLLLKVCLETLWFKS